MMNTTCASLAAAFLLAAAGHVASADSPSPAPQADQATVEQQLEQARARLDEAAQQVAALSTRLDGPMQNRLRQLRGAGPWRAVLGIQVDPDSKGGAKVLQVSPGGAAAEAGIRGGDVIVALDGRDLRKSERPARELVERMRELEPEQKVKLQVLREGKTQTFEVMPRNLPAMFARGFRVPFTPGTGPMGPGRAFMHPERDGDAMLARRSDFGGLQLATLSPQLGAYFGATTGVLVVRAGDRFGDKLRDGDVIVAIDGREPSSGTHATRILRSYQRGEKLSLKLLRDRKSVTLDVPLPPG